MRVNLSDNFTYKRLFFFTLPTVLMMIFTSIYTIVDGIFVANYVGKNALASLNIVWPIITVIGSIGFMLGTGGSAEVARKLGEGEERLASRYFTLIQLTIAVLGIVLSALCIIFIRPLSYFLGASDILIEDCVIYGRTLLFGCTLFMLQTSFQSFFVAANKPQLGFGLTLAAGFANILLDYVLVGVLAWGVKGAAIATICGYAVGGMIPVIYFALPNKSFLHFAKPAFDGKMLLRSAGNGSSEMLSNISMALTTFLYNIQLMRLLGEDGVAAITAIMYVYFIFSAILFGFSMGVAPIISYNYGADNRAEQKNVFKKCAIIIATLSALMLILSESAATPLVALFTGEDSALTTLTARGFRLSAISFIFCGLNIFGSAYFTALCNGKLSALISALRALVLQSLFIMTLPIAMGADGIWLSIAFSEGITAILTVALLVKNRKKYGYA